MTDKLKIIIGADPLGMDLKNHIKKYLLIHGFSVTDITENSPSEYYTVGFEVGKAISRKEYDYGFIFCGTGMGVHLVANKFSGVYAALTESLETTVLSRKINNCNVLALGGLITTPYLAEQMVTAFLSTEFSYDFSENTPEELQKAFNIVSELDKNIQEENKKYNQT